MLICPASALRRPCSASHSIPRFERFHFPDSSTPRPLWCGDAAVGNLIILLLRQNRSMPRPVEMENGKIQRAGILFLNATIWDTNTYYIIPDWARTQNCHQRSVNAPPSTNGNICMNLVWECFMKTSDTCVAKHSFAFEWPSDFSRSKPHSHESPCTRLVQYQLAMITEANLNTSRSDNRI